MNAENRAVTLKASRLKLLPQAIVLVAFLLPFALLAISCGHTLVGKDHVELADLSILAILTAMALLFVWLEVRTLRRLVHSDLLTVTMGGVELILQRTRLYHSWSDLGEPVLQRLNGKSAARSIVLPQRSGGNLVIAAEDYAHEPGDILVILKQAKAGLLIEPAQKPSNAIYVFLAIPASCITLGISIIGLVWITFR
ncbi:hypothetical protein C8J44_2752 [Sphingomonas sp. PP-CE-3A-406]|uniref:hypothetical protein n=1 Tax=Sphingomonas sp. PP-CE-3A-406 TaxID=2135659 RepID=UPI000F129067|nr:hypothetical protein [Sphingomonas sp. PP-CE-3A-406]RMB51733.1 hypothetical protein C8J44_2752 [Sphingomonas sp. PP-CE-3A-406]